MTTAVIRIEAFQFPPRQSAVETKVGQSVGQLMQAVQDLVRQIPGGATMKVDCGWTDAATADELPGREVALRNAELIVAIRKLREKVLGGELFANPAWDMLIELYVAAARGTKVTVGNACITAGLPLTSALRLCHQLHERGLVLRERDPLDRRRVLLCLSAAAQDALTSVLHTSCDIYNAKA